MFGCLRRGERCQEAREARATTKEKKKEERKGDKQAGRQGTKRASASALSVLVLEWVAWIAQLFSSPAEGAKTEERSRGGSTSFGQPQPLCSRRGAADPPPRRSTRPRLFNRKRETERVCGSPPAASSRHVLLPGQTRRPPRAFPAAASAREERRGGRGREDSARLSQSSWPQTHLPPEERGGIPHLHCGDDLRFIFVHLCVGLRPQPVKGG